ncbi:hypothetical protein [Variovorax sp. IB41]|uniref:hypothetical protein n=1 Tax=Variovorax sp. IB41 TaxID=2779370 RepID=UPI0018E82204|nr:hypothetical protein [Variovorax sp. IB41]MBJ2160263.1 hypothetical protein [Variovorax sp. IB41]
MNPSLLGEEPVPEVTQFSLLAFLSALVGYLHSDTPQYSDFKLTIHRIVVHAETAFLQQACGYLSPSEYQPTMAGRIFKGNHGITGKALMEKKTWRTRRYASQALLEQDLVLDITDSGDFHAIEDLPRSWLAVPLLNIKNEVVLIVFGESKHFNFFADDGRVVAIQNMVTAFGNMNARMETSLMERVKNFSVERTPFTYENADAYRRIHEDFGNSAASLMEAGFFNVECAPA